MLSFVRQLIRKLDSVVQRASTAELASACERAYAELLEQRPHLSDDEFFEEFYAASGITRDIPVRLRTLYENIFGYDLAALRPEDNHAYFYDGVDFADVMYRVQREFDLKEIPYATVVKPPLTYRGITNEQGEIDGTFDSVVRYVATELASHPWAP